ncbi:cancer/testis antigen 55 [Cavia porcellus]|uniref:cancer/testis antigen 55 n=1 Tax=Cavia porcellus TaxID=10141 RepID=UPI002FE3B2A6
MLRLLNRALAFFQRRRANLHEGWQRLMPGPVKVRTMQGIVTKLCDDHGLIDECIYFSTDVVTGNIPLTVGHRVFAVVEEDQVSSEVKAIKVEPVYDYFANFGMPDPGTKILIGCVVSIMEDMIYIHKGTSFCLDTVCEGFVPYKGDWLEVVYSMEPGAAHIKAHSVRPLSSRQVEEVKISSVHGREGVIDDSIFFTLDSLQFPAGYVPQPCDIVNVVIVESTQSCYLWRAISMTPVYKY